MWAIVIDNSYSGDFTQAFVHAACGVAIIKISVIILRTSSIWEWCVLLPPTSEVSHSSLLPLTRLPMVMWK